MTVYFKCYKMVWVMYMTMKELAKLCNVSVSTVSKAFSDTEDISRDTKEQIFKIAKQHGCYGKFYKHKYPKKIIAVIFPELKSNYYTAFVEELQRLIEADSGICIISADDFSPEKQSELIEYYASFLKVDGIIVFDLRKELKKGYDTPIVSLFTTTDLRVDSVNTDMKSAIREAVMTLKEYGHKKIAFIGENHTLSKADYFRVAVWDYLKYEAVTVKSDERFEKAGIDGVKQLLSNKCDFTAIICAYDNIAFGAIKELKKQGFKIPEDISVIGIDNISSAEFTETALTSIDTRHTDICSIAFDLLQKKLENKYFKAKQNIIIKPQLIIRESIRNINKQ